MKLFNAFLGTLTAGLVAATLGLTVAAWIDRPDAPDSQIAASDTAAFVQTR